MPDRLTLELATPSRLVVSTPVDEVVVPGLEGAFGVWAGHAPLLALLGVGELSFRLGRQEHYMAVSGGFAEVGPGRVVILAETAEMPEEIDVPRARAAHQRAEARLQPRGGDEVDVDRAQAAIARAQIRLQVAARRPSSA